MTGLAEMDPEMEPEEARAARVVEPRPLAWWGMMLTIAVVATMYAAMYFSYVYIRIGVGGWPPAGIDPPGLGLPALSVGALLSSAAVLWAGLRSARRGDLAGERLSLAAALALAGAHVGLLLLDWTRATFSIDVHSYAALHFGLPAIHLVAFGVGMFMAAIHLALSFRQSPLPRRPIGLRVLGAYWSFLAFGGTALLAVVYLVPHVWPDL